MLDGFVTLKIKKKDLNMFKIVFINSRIRTKVKLIFLFHFPLSFLILYFNYSFIDNNRIII